MSLWSLNIWLRSPLFNVTWPEPSPQRQNGEFFLLLPKAIVMRGKKVKRVLVLVLIDQAPFFLSPNVAGEIWPCPLPAELLS